MRPQGLGGLADFLTELLPEPFPDINRSYWIRPVSSVISRHDVPPEAGGEARTGRDRSLAGEAAIEHRCFGVGSR
jgi:hypothetical protein